MDKKELATKLLEWGEAKEALEALEQEIKDAVLTLGNTQTVGNVRATYSNGKTTFDYEAAGASADQATIEANTKTVVDWRGVCQDLEIDNIPVLKRSAPSVTVKLID